ncbi:MAG: efflux RND transporter periplasmic adaptor subunit [Candidatus Omnitrophota bacterium]
MKKINISFSLIKKHSSVVVIATAIVVILAIIAGRAVGDKPVEQTSVGFQPSVQLLEAKDYKQNFHKISANGTVESLQQIDIKSETSGKITRMNIKVGDNVEANEVLMVVDQSNASATLTSAQGVLAQAQASYEKLLSGATEESVQVAKDSIASAQQSLDSQYNGGINTLNDSYIKMYNAYSVVGSIQKEYFSGNDQEGLTVRLEKDYGIYESMNDSKALIDSAKASGKQSDINIAISQTVSSLNETLNALTVIRGICDSTSYQFKVSSVEKTSLDNQKALISSILTNVTALQQNIASSKLSLQKVENQLNAITAPPTQPDIDLAEAQILAARGQLQAAETAYRNTSIKAPFNGVISSLFVKSGELISAGQKVTSVVNNGKGLQIKVFVSSEDLLFIAIGTAVEIGNKKASGVVTNFSSSVDADTRNAEVDIIVTDSENSGLIIGQNVSVNILGNDDSVANAYILPLQSVKLTSDGKSIVYILDANQRAQEINVTIGEVNGENIEVIDGLFDDAEIISNAYDITTNQKVQISKDGNN